MKPEDPSREVRLSITLLVLLFVVAIPTRAHGAPPKPEALDGGTYFQVSPGVATLVVDERRFARDGRWAWPWSLGVGRMLTRGPLFKATVGASLEHRVFFLDDVGAHGAHALFESRIGAGNRRVWGYGLLGVGPAATILDFGRVFRPGEIDRRDLDDFYGFALQLGGGAQALVGRRFFIGGELDFDFGYYFPNYLRSGLERFHYHTATLEILFGWHF
jgi:hypothetical protein